MNTTKAKTAHTATDLQDCYGRYGLTAAQDSEIMFEEGCRWIERHVDNDALRLQILTDPRCRFWTIFMFQWLRAVRTLDGFGDYTMRMRETVERHNMAIATQLNTIIKRL